MYRRLGFFKGLPRCCQVTSLSDEGLGLFISILNSKFIRFLAHNRPAMPFGNRKKIIKGIFSVLSQFKKYQPSENLIFNYLGIFQSLKLRISMGKNPFNFSSAKFHSKYFGLLWVNQIFSKMRGGGNTEVRTILTFDFLFFRKMKIRNTDFHSLSFGHLPTPR